jgi:hypothetical protein
MSLRRMPATVLLLAGLVAGCATEPRPEAGPATAPASSAAAADDAAPRPLVAFENGTRGAASAADAAPPRLAESAETSAAPPLEEDVPEPPRRPLLVTAPTPYTAVQIRDANPPGTRMVFRLEEDGRAAGTRTIRFIGGIGAGDVAVMIGTGASPSGAPLGAPERSIATWSDLRDHAAFPLNRTTRRRERCTVEAGTFECWLYLVEAPGVGEAPALSRYYFADDRPGPPVLVEEERGGELVSRMELVSDSRGPAGLSAP